MYFNKKTVTTTNKANKAATSCEYDKRSTIYLVVSFSRHTKKLALAVFCKDVAASFIL